MYRRGRKRATPRIRADGKWYGYGREEYDAKSSWLFPAQFMQSQQGRLVSVRYADNSYDFEYSDRLDAAIPARGAVPLISVVSTIPTASETGPTAGLFTLLRSGDTSTAFDVAVAFTGTARMGINYAPLPLTVSFAVDQVLALVSVTPIPGGLAINSGNTVICAAVPDTGSSYYAGYTATPIGPLSSTDYTVVMTNWASLTILP